MTLGQRLRTARKLAGLSRPAVVKALGVSERMLTRYEGDFSMPPLDVLQKMSRLYNISGDYILGNADEMGSSPKAFSLDSSAWMGSHLEDDISLQGEDKLPEHRLSAQGLIDFIAKSPSRFHVVDNICRKLSAEGFTRLAEGESWNIRPGGKYFVTRNQSSIIAFKVGGGDVKGFNIYAAHSDSPTFRVKPNAEMETIGKYIRINTERSGGMICSTWMDRPLSIAGRAVVESEGRIVSKLVNIDKDILLIPNVAIHMQRNINDGMSYNAQTDMIPLMGSLQAKGSLNRMIAASLGVNEGEIIGSDLFLYNRMRGTNWGANGEFISAPSLDDLQCVYAGLMGLLAGENKQTVSMLCVLDNEEVGSGTKQGADSDFLRTAVKRICQSIDKPMEELMPSSFVISADNAHAVHPNRPEYADPVNKPVMNGGIVLKFNGSQRYATDAVSETIFRAICRNAEVPVQVYVNRSDIHGGSTLGNISTSQLSLNTVDIGLAQLAMHSAYETTGAMDTLYLERAAAEFFSTSIACAGDGEYRLNRRAKISQPIEALQQPETSQADE